MDQHHETVKAALYAIAPDIEGEAIAAGVRYRDQFEFDSMDFLRFVLQLHRVTGVEIPEADYPQLDTLDGAAEYLRAHPVRGA